MTNATDVRVLRNGFVAVSEGTAPAKLFRPDAPELFRCSWLVPVATEDGPSARDCGAVAVEFDNGFLCEAGHDHYEYGTYEYYDEEEMEGARKAGVLPANARSMA